MVSSRRILPFIVVSILLFLGGNTVLAQETTPPDETHPENENEVPADPPPALPTLAVPPFPGSPTVKLVACHQTELNEVGCWIGTDDLAKDTEEWTELTVPAAQNGGQIQFEYVTAADTTYFIRWRRDS